MTTEEIGVVADNRGEPGPASSTDGSGSPSSSNAVSKLPEKLRGKSLDDIGRAYSDLETNHTKLAEQNAAYQRFFDIVKDNFTYENGNLDFNYEAIKQKLKEKGVLHKWAAEATGTKQKNSGNSIVFGDEDEGVEDNGKDGSAQMEAKLLELLRAEMSKFRTDELDPIRRDSAALRYMSWKRDLLEKYPEFNDWEDKMASLREEIGMPIRSKRDLEKLLIMTKSVHGEMVPKNFHDSQLRKYQDALEVISPEAASRVAGKPQTELTVDNLFKMEGIPEKKKKETNAFLGREFL